MGLNPTLTFTVKLPLQTVESVESRVKHVQVSGLVGKSGNISRMTTYRLLVQIQSGTGLGAAKQGVGV